MPVIIDRDIYFGQTDLFFNYARKFDAEIKEAGAKTVFFMTWSVKSRPEEQEILTYAYSNIAQELNATVAPVGLVWDALREIQVKILFERIIEEQSYEELAGRYKVSEPKMKSIMAAILIRIERKLGKGIAYPLAEISTKIEEQENGITDSGVKMGSDFKTIYLN